MAAPFLDSLKNIVPSLEKATDLSFILLLTSFLLLADCAALYTHRMNILHLSEIPDVIQPRLAIEAVVLVILFGFCVGVVMWFVLSIANWVVSETILRAWIYAGLSHNTHRSESADTVPLFELRRKAHASKESYYLNLLKEYEESEIESLEKTSRTAHYALTVLVLSGIDLWAPLAPGHAGVLAQIANGLGQHGYGWLFLVGVFLLVLAFYPLFEERRFVAYCPGLAQELDEKRRQEAEKLERFRAELRARAISETPGDQSVGRRLSGRLTPVAGVVFDKQRPRQSERQQCQDRQCNQQDMQHAASDGGAGDERHPRETAKRIGEVLRSEFRYRGKKDASHLQHP